MKIFKNALLSAMIGHTLGLISCLTLSLWALKMANADTAAIIMGVVSSSVGALCMAVASKKLSGGSLVCAILSSMIYILMSFVAGSAFFDNEAFGWRQALILSEGIALPLSMCFGGVLFMSKKRQSRRVRQKIYK